VLSNWIKSINKITKAEVIAADGKSCVIPKDKEGVGSDSYGKCLNTENRLVLALKWIKIK